MYTTALQQALDNLDYGIKNGSCVMMRDEARSLKAHIDHLQYVAIRNMSDLNTLRSQIHIVHLGQTPTT